MVIVEDELIRIWKEPFVACMKKLGRFADANSWGR
jgi:hypothetical protein